MTQQPTRQPNTSTGTSGKRTDKMSEEYAYERLESLIGSGGRYGVPVRVLRPEDAGLPSCFQPNRVSYHHRTGRLYYTRLTKRESEFLQNSLDILQPHPLSPVSQHPIKEAMEKCWSMAIAECGAYTINLLSTDSAPQGHTYAHELGKEKYRDHAGALIFLPHRKTSKQNWIESFLGRPPGTTTNDNNNNGTPTPRSACHATDGHNGRSQLPGTASHWAYWVLEHEIAHTSGAGEPQADMMATAQYIRAFDDISLPRTMADIRAVNAVFRHYSKEYSQLYGWKMVTAIETIVNLGVDGVKSLSEDTIHDMRFRQFEDNTKAVDHFASLLAKQNMAAFSNKSLGQLITTTKTILSGQQIDQYAGARAIAERFLLAAQRLSAASTPAWRPATERSPRTRPSRIQQNTP